MTPDEATTTVLSNGLSEQVFELVDAAGTRAWLVEIDKELGGVTWRHLGGIENNVHTVEVASDPALALVERPINGIDAVLDLAARERGETAATPHAGAQRWYDVPAGGLSSMSDRGRRELAELLQITMLESGEAGKPTIVVQDQGTGQHPEDFDTTLLSLLASNKKEKTHQMGVYNAGGAASCKFASYAIIASRLAPNLLSGRSDEIGLSVVRYNPLDPNRYKSGTYEYLAAKDGSIIRLDIAELPQMSHGTYVKLVEYALSKYARGAHEPKQSLWHLFHGALPDPALPLRVVETRSERFTGVRGVERRTVSGLLHLLSRSGTADYADDRSIDLGPDIGKVRLRYFVLNEGTDPDAYTKSDQGLTVTLNGQRQITKDRHWVKRNAEVHFLYKRLVVVVDGTGLTNAAKRAVFSSTRETGVDSPEAKRILDRVAQELLDDDSLGELDELARQRVLQDATKTTTDKVKKQLASQIGAYMKGELSGAKGGKPRRRKRRRGGGGGGKAPDIDDSMMPDKPDMVKILTDPIAIEPGATAALRLEINAKNDFLPRHSDALSVVFGEELREHVTVRSKGRLLGGKVRVTLEADGDASLTESSMQVALVVPQLGVLLTANGTIKVIEPKENADEESAVGGEPNIDVSWVGRDKWGTFDPSWNAETVGMCIIHREDASASGEITKVEWVMNEAFAPYEQVIQEKQLTEHTMKTFQEAYEYPVLFGLFRQTLAEDLKEREADEHGGTVEIPDDYVLGERARMARAVLMAMEPEMKLAEAADPEPAAAG
jgi:hypothetical protein